MYKLLNTTRVLCGIIFVVSGALKIVAPTDFFVTVASLVYEIPVFDVVIAVSVPIMEIYLGLCLIYDRRVEIVSFLLLFGILIISLVVLVANPQNISNCGCFGDFVVLPLDYSFYSKNLILSTLLVGAYLSKTPSKSIINAC